MSLMRERIDSEAGINVSELTFSKLRMYYGTGRSYIVSGSGRDRKLGYRTGAMTEIGDIEVSVWESLVCKLIVSAGEQELFENLLAWCTETNYCNRTQTDLKNHALELHAMRIFDSEKWVDYVAFNQRYRPDKLK